MKTIPQRSAMVSPTHQKALLRLGGWRGSRTDDVDSARSARRTRLPPAANTHASTCQPIPTTRSRPTVNPRRRQPHVTISVEIGIASSAGDPTGIPKEMGSPQLLTPVPAIRSDGTSRPPTPDGGAGHAPPVNLRVIQHCTPPHSFAPTMDGGGLSIRLALP